MILRGQSGLWVGWWAPIVLRVDLLVGVSDLQTLGSQL